MDVVGWVATGVVAVVVVGGVVARPHTSSRRILSVIAADSTFLRKTQRRKDSENHFLKLSRPRFPAV